MPFTLSHAAAALPFMRRPLVPSALVIGTLAPDLPYYVYVWNMRDLTHRPLGVVTVDVVIGAVAFAVWHRLLKRPLAALAPRRLRERLPVSAPFSRVWVVPSLVIGAATHAAWDRFTHADAARAMPVLAESVGGMALYQGLQLGGSVVGLGVIAWRLARWARTAPVVESPVNAARGRTAVFAAAAGIAAAGCLSSVVLLPVSLSPQSLLFCGIVGSVAGAGSVLVGYCAWWHVADLVGPRRGR